MSTSFAAVAPILVLLIIAAAAAIAYFLFYRRRVNKALQQDGEGGAGPEPASVTRTGFIVVLIIALFLMMLRIGGLSSQIGTLNNEIQQQSMQIQSLRLSIDGLKAAIDKAESAVSSDDHWIIGFNERDNTAEIMFSVIPAKASDDTQVSIVAGDKVVQLEKTAKGSFEGVLKADIFGSYPGVVRALITSGGATVSEELNYTLDGLWVEYLPQLISDGGGETDVNSGKLSVRWHSNVYFQNSDYADFDLKSARLVEETDGKVTSEKDISSELGRNMDMDCYTADVDKKVSYSGSYRLYVTAKDSKGYTHEMVLISLEGTNGRPSVDQTEDLIYDAGGKLLTRQFKY